ncbi:uncharacterized protein BO97DRAFT_427781 [Aspergillus homomorphus CBS 101889]|uniref:Uncharacterized protein n=1 Tax=Aspergillus homomorphus (strain CBS 101889) TaxID=1450537 RepID=A0A395HMP4_ASPHC|nr:hypothetical protein BO97DRAFT_427781 [Aspergillus homomorphus CBS 101889]RAL09107.1 hypothetical protein BO97DRAFT_427781 [Aspergillus homomorphus CBS 101889]
MEFHPDVENVFIGGGCSRHAFNFLSVLVEYLRRAWDKVLMPHLAAKWRYHTEHENLEDAFWGDRSRGGPERRELDTRERSKV